MASAWDAIKSEVLGTGLLVHGYEIDYPTNEQLCYLLEGRELALVRELLGENWTGWKKTHKTRGDIGGFVEELWGQLGITPDHANGLLAILLNDEYLRAFEADLLAQGLSLKAFVTEDISFREMAIIFDGLQEDSRVKRALAGAHGEWIRSEYMLADIMDMLNWQTQLLHILCQANGLKKPARAPKPVYERPYKRDEKVEFTPIQDAKAFFASLG